MFVARIERNEAHNFSAVNTHYLLVTRKSRSPTAQHVHKIVQSS